MAQRVKKADRLEVKVSELKNQVHNLTTQLQSMTENAKTTEALKLQVSKLTSQIESAKVSNSAAIECIRHITISGKKLIEEDFTLSTDNVGYQAETITKMMVWAVNELLEITQRFYCSSREVDKSRSESDKGKRKSKGLRHVILIFLNRKITHPIQDWSLSRSRRRMKV